MSQFKLVRELRFHLCQTSPASEGLRGFLKSNYKSIKQSNPKLPILIRECNGTPAQVYAVYGTRKPLLLYRLWYRNQRST
jgi:NADH dehydrogenase (ubiquinone) 1 alpha subcomplex subunit 2